jgi:predicted aldo/keto reductase-like oxidoreductase
MQYRQLSKKMLPISILGFGCMRFYRVDGSLNFMDQTTPVDEKLVNRLIHYAMEQGVNYYDTEYQAGMQGYKDAVEKGIGVMSVNPSVYSSFL